VAGSNSGGAGSGGKGGASCLVLELLFDQNPNFDDSNPEPLPAPEDTPAPDPAPWYEYTSDGTATVNPQEYLSSAGVTAHSGKNAVWLGGEGSTYTFDDGTVGEFFVIDLDLTIPVGTTDITLSCYYQTQTEETASTVQTSRDGMVAWLWDYKLKESAYRFQTWGPANSSPGWHAFSNTARGATAAALAGRALSLEFYAEVDNVRRSDFFIDTCSLKATVCN
jgi:hypothetical protein